MKIKGLEGDQAMRKWRILDHLQTIPAPEKSWCTDVSSNDVRREKCIYSRYETILLYNMLQNYMKNGTVSFVVKFCQTSRDL